MTTCNGKVPNKSFICGSAICRCTKCGAIGCRNANCSNQRFSAGKCLMCGNYGTAKEV